MQIRITRTQSEPDPVQIIAQMTPHDALMALWGLQQCAELPPILHQLRDDLAVAIRTARQNQEVRA